MRDRKPDAAERAAARITCPARQLPRRRSVENAKEVAKIIREEYAPLVAALERVPETGCRDSFGNLCRDSRACLYCAARAALGSEGGAK